MAPSAGEELKKARLARNLTVEQVAKATRIRERYLEALENSELNVLPSKTQTRGFLRLYADYLGLPVDATTDQWNREFSATPTDATKSTGEAGAETTRDPGQEESPAVDEDTAETNQAKPQSEALSGSQAIFKEIGMILRTQRETLFLKLEDIEHYTHVPHHHLQALENGDIDKLPSPVQGRGMLSNYATFLELNVDELTLRFADGLQARRIESLGDGAHPQDTLPRQITRPSTLRRLLTPDLLIGTLLILSLLGFTIWTTAQINTIKTNNARGQEIPALSTLLMMTSTGSSFLQKTETATPSLPPRQNPPSSGGDTSSGRDNSGASIQATGIPTLDNLPLQLYIVAHQRGFLQVTADGKVVFLGRMTPGNAYPFSAREQLELLTGNAAAVEVYYNRENLGILGQIGQVANLVFTKSGIYTPTPSFTDTPTNTPVPSVTLQPSPTPVTPTITPYIPKKTP